MIRELTISDEGALTAFFEDNNRAEVTSMFHPFPLDAVSAHRICAAPRRDRYFAAWEESGIAGMAMLRGWDEGYEVPSFGIIVHHAKQGRGVGRALTEHAVQTAREMGAARVRLTVRAENERAVALYERAGFRRVETLPDGRLVMFADCG